jgi:DNA-binding MurR/RpiR family transcriptional regulator
VVQLVHESMPRMSGAERRVAHALLADFPGAALGTVSELAGRAEVSTASVMRFCTRLGLDGFAGLGARVREELSSGGASPIGRARTSHPAIGIEVELDHRADLVRAARERIPPHELDRLLEALADPNRAVLTAGGSLSQLAARYLQLQLRHIRPRVVHLADPMQADIGTVLDLRRRDLLVVFDFRRYEPRTAALVEAAKERGAMIALITDVWLSPIANTADIVIPLDVEASFLDSLTAVFALVESLVPATAARMGEVSLRRMDEVETLRGRPAR